jgi:adenylate cyclase
VRVTGRDRTARIFELLAAAGEPGLSADDLRTFDEGLTAYRAARWDEAERAFRAFAQAQPTDGPAHVMLARVQELRQRPPARWDGVYEQRSK